MKPGDLVRIADFLQSSGPFPIGIVINVGEDDLRHRYAVLVGGVVKRYDLFHLRRIKEDETR